MFYSIARFFLYVIFKVYFRIQVVGQKNFPKNGAVIVASNHLSYLDPVAVGLISPRKLNYLARKDLFRHKLFGFLLKNLGVIPVKKDTEYDVRTFKKLFRILAAGGSLGIFPEGTRSQNGKLKKMQRGVGFLAVKSGCPVVPVLVVGTDKAMPVKSKIIKPKKIRVYVGKALFPDESGPKKDNIEKFSRRVEDIIKKMDAQFRK